MKKILLLVIFLLSLPVFGQDNKEIAFGPYLQNMSDDGVTICWSTFKSNSKIIHPDGTIKIIPDYQQHKIHLTRLEPDTEYSYDVLNKGLEEGMGKFKTYPDEITSFNFAVLGDTRSRHDVHAKIVERIIKQDPLFVINTGDMVSDGRAINDWKPFFEVNNKLMRNIPYYAVLGNHEKDSPYFYDFFPPPGDNNYYSFSIGDAVFLILDSEGRDISEPNYISEKNSEKFWNDAFVEYFTKQKEWVDKELKLHKEAGFVFVFQHKPLFSIKRTRAADAIEYRKFWGDLFERHNVQVFMNGHDHHYHHALKNGVHYITTAGGGAGLYDTDSPQPETVSYSKVEHYVSITVGEDTATLNVIDIDGNEIDKIIVNKRTLK